MIAIVPDQTRLILIVSLLKTLIKKHPFLLRKGSTIADVILWFAFSPKVGVVPVKTAFQEVVKSGSVEETKLFDIDTERFNFKGAINNTASVLNDRFCTTNNKG